jgi:hypothetical protein
MVTLFVNQAGLAYAYTYGSADPADPSQVEYATFADAVTAHPELQTRLRRDLEVSPATVLAGLSLANKRTNAVDADLMLTGDRATYEAIATDNAVFAASFVPVPASPAVGLAIGPFDVWAGHPASLAVTGPASVTFDGELLTVTLDTAWADMGYKFKVELTGSVGAVTMGAPVVLSTTQFTILFNEPAPASQSITAHIAVY